MKPAIRVENLSKSYRIGTRPNGEYRTLRESIADVAVAPWRCLRDLSRWGAGGNGEGNDSAPDHIWALKDVTFEVHPGEVVGIIGRNGAGKSTLLKILSRITEPTSGRAEFRGRIGSLLEVGTGFHPELSGRENIYLNGTVLGMSRREIDRKFDEIVAFSEIEKFLDTPVKRYSSGMYVRLAFGVAAHLEPEILLVDEVLAVGDTAFQRKCVGKMHDLSESGRTILFVSHNMPAVRTLTTRCLYLEGGRFIFAGPTHDAINKYLHDGVDNRKGGNNASLSYFRRDKADGSPVRITRIWVDERTSSDLARIHVGDDFTIHCEIESSRNYPRASVAFWLMNERGERVTTALSLDQRFRLSLSPGAQVVSCKVQGLPLSPGRFTLTIGVTENTNTKALDVIVDYPVLETVFSDIESGALDWPNRPWGTVHWSPLIWNVNYIR
jgi:lipopolysaccharide transport system ATP-binding protein